MLPVSLFSSAIDAKAAGVSAKHKLRASLAKQEYKVWIKIL